MPRGRKPGTGKYGEDYRLRLSKEQLDALRKMAKDQECSASEVLRDLIEKAFNT